MGGLSKRGPKHKRRKKSESKRQVQKSDKPLTEEQIRRLMEEGNVYRRGRGGAMHQIR